MDLGNIENNVINSSKPFEKLIVKKNLLLSKLITTNLSLLELKLLDLYVAVRESSNNSNCRKVILEKSKIQNALNVTIRTEVLEEYLLHLKQGIKGSGNEDTQTTDLIHLFKEAKYYKDKYGQGMVLLEATEDAANTYFDVEQSDCFMYKFKDVALLKSRYSYALYIYIQKNQPKRFWEVSVNDLRNELRCNDTSYQRFGVFNERVLKSCYRELTEVVGLEYTYEVVKKLKNAVAIRFKVRRSRKLDCFEDQEEKVLEEIKVFYTICRVKNEKNNEVPEFTEEEMRRLRIILDEVPRYKLPGIIGQRNDIESQRFLYVKNKYEQMNKDNMSRLIKNRYAYLYCLIEKDAEDYV